MFIHNLDPVIFSIGPLAIRWYGLAYVIGFLLVWWTMHKKHEDLKISKDDAADIAFWLAVGVMVGSRLYSTLVWSPAYYLANPIKIFYLWEGGMAFHGGLLGIIAALVWMCKKHKLDFAKLADTLTMPVIFALALGRIANFINGELYGPITDLSWCVQFPGAEGCRHPYQLYAALKRFAVVGILFAVSKTKHKKGFIFWLSILLLGIGRFTLDFVREDILYAGLSIGQWSSAIMVIVAGYILFKKYR